MFSRPYQKFFEGLTATFSGEGFLRAVERDPENVHLYDKPRGSPLNVGRHLTAVHPIVRTNPVTGWKSIFAVGGFPRRINELEETESRELLDRFYRVILDNHDITVRFRWRNKNDIGESILFLESTQYSECRTKLVLCANTCFSNLGQPECLPLGYLRLPGNSTREQGGWYRGEAVFGPQQQVQDRGFGGAGSAVELGGC